ncbi:MAG: hypothetical protein QMD14_03970 [Candidatus Aenigmarchaeota archaeon]|nr:hypothetical protein [Candidatus Aenigmarchaeota archaeon]
MVRYPGLHPLVNLIFGISSILLVVKVFLAQPSLINFMAWLIGITIGIAINDSWFLFIEKHFNLYLKFLLKRKGFYDICKRSVNIIILSVIACALGVMIFFNFGVLPLISLLSGIMLTGLLFYGMQKDFYEKLIKSLS